MKVKFLFFSVLLLITFFACNDSTNDPDEEFGTIYIESTPSGAEIWIDGNNTEKVTPSTIEVKADSHLVVLKFEGYSDLEFNIVVNPGENIEITSGTVLNKLNELIIESDPSGASIYLNGINTGENTPHTFIVPDDTYFIFLELDSYADTTHVTKLENGETVEVSIVLKPN